MSSTKIGLNQISSLNTNETLDTYLNKVSFLGGQVETIGNLSTITPTQDMHVFVKENNKWFRYNNGSWVDISSVFTLDDLSNVVAPSTGNGASSNGQFLVYEGSSSSWKNTTISNATTTSDGFMSSTDKTKLDGISDNANNYIHPSGDGNNHVPPTNGGNVGKFLRVKSNIPGDLEWADIPTTGGSTTLSGLTDVTINSPQSTNQILQYNGSKWVNVTISSATTTDAGFMSATDKTKLNGIAIGSVKVEDSLINGNIKITDSSGTQSQVVVYEHPIDDGNLHVPSTGTVNGGKFLQAGSNAGSFSWSNINLSDVTMTTGDGLDKSNSTLNIKLDTNSGLVKSTTGLKIDFGTTANKVSEGNHTHTFASLTSKPTTLSEYGITDALNTSSTAQTKDGSLTVTGGVTASLNGNATTATTLQTGRDIALTGDVTGTAVAFNGSANVSISTTLANSGVTAGTYNSVTVDEKGRVTAGTNPTTLAGHGIGDAYTKVEANSLIQDAQIYSLMGVF